LEQANPVALSYIELRLSILSSLEIGVIYKKFFRNDFMFLSLILILLIAAGGFALTYLFADDETFLWRISAGNIIGAAAFGTTGFILANFFGLSAVTVLISLVLTILPLILFTRIDFQKRFGRDWAKAKGKLQGANIKKGFRFVYYAFFFILLRAVRRIWAICRFISARFFPSQKEVIFRRKIHHFSARNLRIRLLQIF